MALRCKTFTSLQLAEGCRRPPQTDHVPDEQAVQDFMYVLDRHRIECEESGKSAERGSWMVAFVDFEVVRAVVFEGGNIVR